jgi:hypothetical protein
MKRSHLLIPGIILLVLFIAVPLIIFFYQPQQPVAANTIQVTINPAITIGTISPDFPGLGLEPSSVCAMLSLDQQGPKLSNMFKNLGPAILRFGGDTVENTYWSPTGTASCSYDNTTLNRASINDIFSFARKSGLRIIWPVNLKDEDPATYSDEAAYAVASGGHTLAALEIGNEPDLYGWSYGRYSYEWERYAKAIKAKSPNAPLSGPALCCDNSWFTDFLNDDSSRIMLATQHIYPLTSGTIKDMMDPSLMRETMTNIDHLVQAAKAKHLALQIDETDPFTNVDVAGGYNFASSLWTADYMLSAAEHGVVGVNIFGQLPPDQESPLNQDGSPRGTYYGALFFHNAAPGNSKILKPQISSSANVTAHAMLGTDGKLRVSLINKEQKKVTVQINTTQTYMSASVMQLRAPSITATSGIKLAGAAVSSNGTWSPLTTNLVKINNDRSSIDVPADSAVIIAYQNGNSGITPMSSVTQNSRSNSPYEITAFYCSGSNNCPATVPTQPIALFEASSKKGFKQPV